MDGGWLCVLPVFQLNLDHEGARQSAPVRDVGGVTAQPLGLHARHADLRAEAASAAQRGLAPRRRHLLHTRGHHAEIRGFLCHAWSI